MKTNIPIRVSGYLMAPLMIACLAASGCVSTSSSAGAPIDAQKVARIEKGKTTRAEVEALLGKPEATTMLGDGKRCLSYAYTATSMGVRPSTMLLGPFAKVDGTTRTQTLQVFVGKDGVVEDYELGDTTRDITGSALNHQSTVR